MRITQNYNLLLKELIVAAEIQFDLNQLFTVINAIDKDNLSRPGSVFDWGNTKLNNVNDPLGEIGDSTDLQVAVTKNWLKDKLFAAGKLFDPATGNWHLHTNKAILDAITDAGDGAIPSAAERARFLTQQERDALTNANAPTGSNPLVTMLDIGALPSALVAETWFSDSYNGSVANGATLNTTTLGTSGFGLLKARLEAALVGGSVSHYGAIEFNLIKNSAGELWFELLKCQGKKNAGATIETEYPFPSLDMSSSAEAARNVWNLLGAGVNVPRLYGPLPDGTPVIIGLAGDNTNYSGIYITRSGTNVYFSIINGTGYTDQGKLSIFGFKR